MQTYLNNKRLAGQAITFNAKIKKSKKLKFIIKSKGFDLKPKRQDLVRQQNMLDNLPPNSYLMLLIVLQIAMLIFSLLGRFNSGVYFIMMRVLFLVMAQCCKQPRSAAFYSVLALMNGFYAFDPVGLFITGHGQSRSFAANIFCIIACAIAFIASYIGYFYKLSLEKQNPDGQQGFAGGNAPNPAYLYNGNNLGYVNPNDRNNQNPYSGAGTRSFQPFQGAGHALG